MRTRYKHICKCLPRSYDANILLQRLIPLYRSIFVQTPQSLGEGSDCIVIASFPTLYISLSQSIKNQIFCNTCSVMAFYAFAAFVFRNGRGLALDGMHRAVDMRFEEMRLVKGRLSVRIDANGGGGGLRKLGIWDLGFVLAKVQMYHHHNLHNQY